MTTTNINLKEISKEDLLNRKEQEYNPSIWKDKINSLSKYEKLKFYICEPSGGYDYTRFFVSYVVDGIYFFNKFSAFSSSITSNGFCKVFIIDGIVYKKLFRCSNGKEGYAENCKENRLSFAKDLTPMNIMVSNCI